MDLTQRELVGKVALITGVSRRAGIGAAIATELARAGANIFATFFRPYDAAQTWGSAPNETELLLQELAAHSSVFSLELDLSEPSAAGKLFERAIKQFGRVDILVNNAAHWEPGGIDRTDAA